ncbi:MAG: LysM peptidoglycan-binding domain-containing protein [Treponema sp.]|jgi:membrane-bound lytic murein transglycosylase D|nr:LysM peptidoglycan-binding domain-containing protein [Treponema sp.]
MAKNFSSVILFLFFFILGLMPGLTKIEADERPLRTASTATASTATPAAASVGQQHRYSLSVAANSLLTETNLSQPLTQRYIAQYSARGGITYLNSVLDRGNIYLPFIIQEVEKRGLPPELVYLPIIESSFQITARSRSGAVGLWQFMMNSISPFDMKVTDSIDERRDFIKSTRGALQKLEENYNVLGSWELALAAYNVGLGATNRMVQRTGVRDYWELSRRKQFRQETEHFVPKLIAAAYVVSNPRKYGINVWRTPFEWTTVPLSRQVSLDVIAEEAEIDKDLLRCLNAQWLHGISPAGQGYNLIIPAEKSGDILALLEREDLRLIRYHYHIIRQGDTLWSMSRHYGTPLNIIEQHNPGINNRFLRIGDTVIIPAFGDAPAGLPARIADAPARAAGAFNGSHTVQKGDTLWSLARVYGVAPQALAEANGMELNGVLREGRVLRVPILE